MSKIHRVANHFKYMRSNIYVVAVSFAFVLVGALTVQSFMRASGVLATGYYDDSYYADSQDYPYDNGDYANYNGGYGGGEGCQPQQNSCYPQQPTYEPRPAQYQQPNYICTWMKATISDRTVSLTAQGNISGYGQIMGYKYDFGDGFVAGASGPLAHTYSRYATYSTKAWIQYNYYGKVYWTAPCTLVVRVQGGYDGYPNCGGYQQSYCERPEQYRDYQDDQGYQDDRPLPTYEPYPSYTPQPLPESPAPAPNGGGGITNNNNNTNNNNSSANAVANVYLTKGGGGDSIASVIPVGYSGSTSAAGYSPGPSGGGGMMDGGMPLMLPETGSGDVIMGYLGLGGLVTAGVGYVLSRRELADTFLKRN